MNEKCRYPIWTAACTLLLALCATPLHAAILRAANPIPGEYIVVLNKNIPKLDVASIANEVAATRGRIPRKIWSSALNGFYIKMTEEEAEAMSQDPFVAYVSENASMTLAGSTMPTNVDPATCALPGATNCSNTADNRLWHLDRLDQDSAAPSNNYAYCNTGVGSKTVTIYVVDTGVHAQHTEFLKSDGTSRVQSGYVSIDNDVWPADNPCGGWNTVATGPVIHLDRVFEQNQLDMGHGTGAASLAAGKKVGVAKDAIIVPVKVQRCDRYKPRYRQANTAYAVGSLVFDVNAVSVNGQVHKYWIAEEAGTSSSADAVNWSADPLTGLKQDGGIKWREFQRPTTIQVNTSAMFIDGLDWVATVAPNPSVSPSVVNISAGTTFVGSGAQDIQDAVDGILARGIPVIASANNLDGDACTSAPAAFSRDNPYGRASEVITVGGTMLLNDPDGTYDPTQPVRDGRWTCANPNGADCEEGSNGGPCVTLFAPAHRLSVASHYGSTSYRDRTMTLPNSQVKDNSGTSWAAPQVAGVVAGYLQNGNLTLSAIYNQLIADSRPDLDVNTLNPKTGTAPNEVTIYDTPNLLLRAGNVSITSHPQSTAAAVTPASTVLSVTSPTSGVTYQWYRANSGYDLTEQRGVANATLLTGETGSTLTLTSAPSVATGYFVRVQNCGAADSDLAVVVPRPGAPSNVVATASQDVVTITWSAGSNAEQYAVQRQVNGTWTTVTTVSAGTLTYNYMPLGAAATGMGIFRVVSEAGLQYLPSNALSSTASNNDVANLDNDTYDNLAVAPNFINFTAQMLTELRAAANSLATAAGVTSLPFTQPETVASSLQGQTIDHDYLTDVMDAINALRQNSLGMTEFDWTNEPEADEVIVRSFIEDLRNALE